MGKNDRDNIALKYVLDVILQELCKVYTVLRFLVTKFVDVVPQKSVNLTRIILWVLWWIIQDDYNLLMYVYTLALEHII